MQQDVQIKSDADLVSANPRIQKFWKYAQSCRHDAVVPERARFDPTDIPSLLKNIFIIDADMERDRLSYRLVGTSIVTGIGFDPTGRDIAELLAERLALNPKLLDRYWFGARSGIATWRRGSSRFWPKMEYVEIENLIIPFSTTDNQKPQLIGMSIHYKSDGSEY